MQRASRSEPSITIGSPYMLKPLAITDRAPAAVEGQPGDRQAALRAELLVGGQRQLRVDQVPELALDVVREHAQADADLRRGQAGAGRVLHGVGEVRDQAAQLGVEVDDRLGLGDQDGVAEQADGLDRHRLSTAFHGPGPGKSSWLRAVDSGGRGPSTLLPQARTVVSGVPTVTAVTRPTGDPMPTAARGATLILLGALLAQAPLTAAAYQPRDRSRPARRPPPIPTSHRDPDHQARPRPRLRPPPDAQSADARAAGGAVVERGGEAGDRDLAGRPASCGRRTRPRRRPR